MSPGRSRAPSFLNSMNFTASTALCTDMTGHPPLGWKKEYLKLLLKIDI
ncbi:unnamed protein product [Staurois parvus]|uniref:Uncharacterized protein n=1 Tax=Staurois parvus TaxID=386267 RepID=A0ABN9AUS3_9NEOB|nr:unnamed protein product [Staurois parvus]